MDFALAADVYPPGLGPLLRILVDEDVAPSLQIATSKVKEAPGARMGIARQFGNDITNGNYPQRLQRHNCQMKDTLGSSEGGASSTSDVFVDDANTVSAESLLSDRPHRLGLAIPASWLPRTVSHCISCFAVWREGEERPSAGVCPTCNVAVKDGPCPLAKFRIPASWRSSPADADAKPDSARTLFPPPSVDKRSGFLFELGDEDSHQMPEYASEVFDLYLLQELPCDPAYMQCVQTDINARMRAILMDWLIEVHRKYKLRTETLFLTQNIIDRVLSAVPVPRARLQLVGVASMLVASKFEDPDPPTAHQFAHITDNSYTTSEVLDMEIRILETLDFKLAVPTAHHFFEPLQKANKCNRKHRRMVLYLLECALVDRLCIGMSRYKPSELVAAAFLCTNRLAGRSPAYPPSLALSCRYDEACLQECAGHLDALLSNMLEAKNKIPI